LVGWRRAFACFGRRSSCGGGRSLVPGAVRRAAAGVRLFRTPFVGWPPALGCWRAPSSRAPRRCLCPAAPVRPPLGSVKYRRRSSRAAALLLFRTPLIHRFQPPLDSGGGAEPIGSNNHLVPPSFERARHATVALPLSFPGTRRCSTSRPRVCMRTCARSQDRRASAHVIHHEVVVALVAVLGLHLGASRVSAELHEVVDLLAEVVALAPRTSAMRDAPDAVRPVGARSFQARSQSD